MWKEITELTSPEVCCYSEKKEVLLLHSREPDPGIFIAESCKVTERALDAGYEPISFFMEKRQAEGEARALLQRCPEVPVYVAEPEVFKQVIGYGMTRGVLCAMKRRPVPSLETVCRGATRLAVLENVENPTNLGAIFRSAAAMGMDGVLLTRGCTDPLYRRAIRVSMGCVFQVPWTWISDERGGGRGGKEEPGEFDTAARLPGREVKPPLWPDLALNRLKDMGFHLYAMALCDDAVSIAEIPETEKDKIAILLGTEGDGLTKETLDCCDRKVIIPMHHEVDSLNVAAASAVAFWELRKR